MRKAFVYVVAFSIYFSVSYPLMSLAAEPEQSQKFDPVPFSWYERNAKKTIWLALDEVAVFEKDKLTGNRGLSLGRRITKQNRFMTLYETAEPLDRKQFLSKNFPGRSAFPLLKEQPVFYTSPRKNPDDRVVPTGEIVVQFKEDLTESEIKAVEETYGFEPVTV